MSDTPVRARTSAAKRPKAASAKRVSQAKEEAVLLADFDAMMERSSKRIAQLKRGYGPIAFAHRHQPSH